MPNNQYSVFTFAPIIETKDRWITAKLSSADANAANHIAVWGTLIEKSSGLWFSFDRAENSKAASIVNFKEQRSSAKQRYLFPEKFINPKLADLSVTLICSGALMLNSADSESLGILIKRRIENSL